MLPTFAVPNCVVSLHGCGCQVNYEGFVTFKEHFDGGQFNIIIPLNTDYSGGRYILKAINKELQVMSISGNIMFIDILLNVVWFVDGTDDFELFIYNSRQCHFNDS